MNHQAQDHFQPDFCGRLRLGAQWWKEATFYQICPASSRGSNGDGWCDIPSILKKIPYIASFSKGVVIAHVLELADMGHDISGYEVVYPPYGTV